MKTVNYFNEVESSQVMGMNQIPVGPVSGEFLGLIRDNGQDYLIARTTLAFKDDPNYVGKITARHAVVEKYSDGSGNIYMDIEEDDKTRNIEEALTQMEKSENRKITEELLRPKTDKRFDSVINREELVAVAINHDLFQKKEMVVETLERPSSIDYGRTY